MNGFWGKSCSRLLVGLSLVGALGPMVPNHAQPALPRFGPDSVRVRSPDNFRQQNIRLGAISINIRSIDEDRILFILGYGFALLTSSRILCRGRIGASMAEVGVVQFAKVAREVAE